MNYQDIDSAKKFVDFIKILIVSATEIETSVIHSYFEPLNSDNKIYRIYIDKQTYYIAKYGKYCVVHFQCNMGTTGTGASLTSTKNALIHWNVNAVIMIGIAFGLDAKNQKIGDVLLSSSLIQYDFNKIKNGKTIHRGPTVEAGETLYNRFKNSKIDWEHNVGKDKIANVIPGPLLSGNTLIDDVEYRDELIKSFPNAIGGEMEGFGIYTSCNEKQKEWIVIKGICDFADGKKSVNKEYNQKMAANSAASFCKKTLNSEFCLNGLGIYRYENISEDIKERIPPINVSNVLFDVYCKKHELFYILRDEDNEIKLKLRCRNLWINGKSGTGKTSLIRKYLISDNKKFCFIDLSSSVGENIDVILANIFQDLCNFYSVDISNNFPKDSYSIIRKIIEIIELNIKNDDIYIYMDEIPISGLKDIKLFINKIYAILIGLSYLEKNYKVKFIISTIVDPTEFIDIHSEKISEKVEFYKIDYWNNDDILKLINMLNIHLETFISTENMLSIVKLAKNNPRLVKNFFRKFVYNGYHIDNIEYLMKEAVGEI